MQRRACETLAIMLLFLVNTFVLQAHTHTHREKNKGAHMQQLRPKAWWFGGTSYTTN